VSKSSVATTELDPQHQYEQELRWLLPRTLQRRANLIQTAREKTLWRRYRRMVAVLAVTAGLALAPHAVSPVIAALVSAGFVAFIGLLAAMVASEVIDAAGTKAVGKDNATAGVTVWVRGNVLQLSRELSGKLSDLETLTPVDSTRRLIDDLRQGHTDIIATCGERRSETLWDDEARVAALTDLLNGVTDLLEAVHADRRKLRAELGVGADREISVTAFTAARRASALATELRAYNNQAVQADAAGHRLKRSE
jgi:hypothetical protein